MCVQTVGKYRRTAGLPVCCLPDGRLFTTKNLLDQWTIARMIAQDPELQADLVDNPGSSVDKPEQNVIPTPELT